MSGNETTKKKKKKTKKKKMKNIEDAYAIIWKEFLIALLWSHHVTVRRMCCSQSVWSNVSDRFILLSHDSSTFFNPNFPRGLGEHDPKSFISFFHFPFRTLSHLKMRTMKHLEWFHFLSKISMGFLFRDKLSFFFGIRPWTHDSTPWISFSPFLGFQFGG